MGSRPEIAVVIGAYDRREFLRAAVESVLRQTLSRDRFEIVVTKNFADEALDARLAQERVVTLRDSDPKIGSWMLRAVGASEAPLVAFLDDDDEYEPDRLERVLAAFAEHPEIVYYRNRVRVIDRAGAPVPEARWRGHELDPALDAPGPVLLGAEDEAARLDLGLARGHGSFNSSTIVVRRELLAGANGERLRTVQLPDSAMYILAALGPHSILLDPARLTRFRFYDLNVTHRIPWLRVAAEEYRSLGEYAAATQHPRFARWLRGEGDHYDRLYHGGRIVESVAQDVPRRAVAALSAQYLRYLNDHPRERALTLDVWGAAGYGAGYLVSRRLARRVMRIRPTARLA